MWFASFLVDLLYPPRCPGCRSRLPQEGSPPICTPCLSTFQYAPPIRIEAGLARSGRPKFPLGVDCSYSVFAYHGALRECLQAMKYRSRPTLARYFSTFLEAFAQTRPELRDVDLVVPIPLHPRRLRHRGFNQAALLAIPVAQTLKKPLNAHLVVRRRWTRQQTTLSAAARWQNVEGAFDVRERSPAANRHVLLVDDILTTGATAHACGRALREAGARRVDLLTLARGGPLR